MELSLFLQIQRQDSMVYCLQASFIVVQLVFLFIVNGTYLPLICCFGLHMIRPEEIQLQLRIEIVNTLALF